MCFGLAIVLDNTSLVDFNFLIASISAPIGVLVVGALAIGIIVGLLLDELANFLSSRVRKSKVKKLESEIQKLSNQ